MVLGVANRNLAAAGERTRELLFENITQFQAPPHSLPGQMPHRYSGELSETLRTEKHPNLSRIAAAAEHAIYLEFGTETMAPRPFMRRTLLENEDEIGTIAIRGTS